MKNVKAELFGEQNWPTIGVVKLDADPDAQPLPAERTQEEEEQIQNSWNKVAVLEVSPNSTVHIGFIREDGASHLLKEPIETSNGKFGMRLAPQPAIVFAVAVDFATPVRLEMVEITTVDNSAYENLPLY